MRAEKPMSKELLRKFRTMLLPGLKRWIVIIFFGIVVIVVGTLLLLGYHPITVTGSFLRDLMEHAAEVLPHRISGIMAITIGGLIVCFAVIRAILSILGAYIPDDRESIPEALYKRRHLDSGPKIAVIGGGTGLSTMLRGLKNYTTNITAIVTVGDDGGSSGRLRAELGVLPPGDIRNCITALADEEKVVTDLFQYRFESGQGLEGHNFGNLFLTAIYSMTDGNFMEAVRVAGKVLNIKGTVLPATLKAIQLSAEMEDGSMVAGESHITEAGGRIKRLICEPEDLKATPEAIEAILDAELIILGPGSLYTSIIPNLLIKGIADAIRKSKAKKLYVCNVMTQKGETEDYTVGDHCEALLAHSGTPMDKGYKLIDAVLINDQIPVIPPGTPARPVPFDQDKIRSFGLIPVKRGLVSPQSAGHHDPQMLSKIIMLWFFRTKRRKPVNKVDGSPFSIELGDDAELNSNELESKSTIST